MVPIDTKKLSGVKDNAKFLRSLNAKCYTALKNPGVKLSAIVEL